MCRFTCSSHRRECCTLSLFPWRKLRPETCLCFPPMRAWLMGDGGRVACCVWGRGEIVSFTVRVAPFTLYCPSPSKCAALASVHHVTYINKSNISILTIDACVGLITFTILEYRYINVEPTSSPTPDTGNDWWWVGGEPQSQ